MERFLSDLRYAVRGLRRSRAFTLVALLTLALGIGANTAIFSIVRGVILRPLPYPKPEQLMHLSTQEPTVGAMRFPVSVPEYFEFQRINQSFAVVGAYTTGELDLSGGDRPLRVRAAFVDEHLLAALGVQTADGRLFAAGETNRSGPPAPGLPAPLPPLLVILSHELWQGAFAGEPMVGQTVEVGGRRPEVIGIMRPGADVVDNRTQIWLPLGLNPANPGDRRSHNLYLIGRLKDGVTPQAAQAELNTLIQNWGERVGVKGHVFAPPPQNGASDAANPDAGHILHMTPLQADIVGSAGRSIWVLQVAVGLVLLIACANLANLLLARAETRRREFAVRKALGASRGQLLRQFITEGVLVSIAGGALGIVLARVAVQALVRTYPTSLPRTSEIALDPVVLFFTLGVSTATGVIFGLAPITHTRLKGLVTALKEAGAKGAAGAAHHRIRHGLVIAEVALAVMLVVGAGLLLRTVYNLTNVDAGFDRTRLVTFSMTLPQAAYPPTVRAQKFQQLLDTLRAVPGVQRATTMLGLPPNRTANNNFVDVEHYTAPPGGPVEVVHYEQYVMSDYFETMGIPLVQGRGFRAADAASLSLVVNETFVKTFLRGQDPIGQRVKPCCSEQMPWFTVVGVARDVKQRGVDQPTGTELYFFAEQTTVFPPPRTSLTPPTMNVVLRTALPPAALARTIDRVVREVDPRVPVVRLRDMEEVFTESIGRPRLLAQLLVVFAGLALLLAAIGTYGVLSCMVAERRGEIGIRMALGADRFSVLAQVMKQGLLLTTIGVLAGLAGAFGLNRLIASLLFGVQPTDGPTLAAVVAAITLVAAVACWLPAWRASRIDPLIALRSE